MAANDTILLQVIGHAGLTEHIHTLHFRDTVGTGAAGLITDWQTACAATYRGCFAGGDTIYELLRAQVVCGATPLPAAVEVAIPSGAGQLGTRAFTALRMPQFVASLTSVRTALAGRSRRGRFFLGGIQEGDGDLNTFTAAYIGYVQAYINALKAAYVTPLAPSYRLVVHSRKLAAVPGTNCQDSSTPVLDMVISQYPTTMRSRKLGHGG